LKKLLLLLAFLAQHAIGAYSFGIAADTADPVTFSPTLLKHGVTITTGDRVLVLLTYGTGSGITLGVSDGTNTYTQVGATLSDATAGQSMALFECVNATGGTYTFTGSFTPGQFAVGIGIRTYAGLDGAVSATMQSNNPTNPGTSANALATANITPGSQPGLIFAATMDVSGGETITAGSSPLTSRGTFAVWNTQFGVGTMTEDKRVTSTSATNATFTTTVGTGRFLNIVAFVPETGAGGGGAAPAMRMPLSGVGF
jgi:hypothetical protein